MSGRVYSYLRFSDPKQAAGSSIERQLAYAKRWAAEHSLALDESLSLRDEGLSAYHQRHVKSGALGVFLVAVEEGRIPSGSVLIVEGLDRLSRAEPIQAQAQLARIVDAGITVVTASDSKAYNRERLKANPMDLVYSLLVMIRAHEESDTKSKRVNAALRRQCEGWLAGTYRGFVRAGRDPQWLIERPEATQAGPDAWDIHPGRAEAVRYAMTRYVQGVGADQICNELRDAGLTTTEGATSRLQVYRTKDQAGLIGTKTVKVEGQEYALEGYYPPLIDREMWALIRDNATDRVRRKTPSDMPSVVTGLNITVCGYCGQAMVGQNVNSRNPLADGRYKPGYRRLRCVGWVNTSKIACPIAGSASVVPVERAIMSYCSDLINLQSLYTGTDRAGQLRAKLAGQREAAAKTTGQLGKLTELLLTTDDLPATILAKMRALEAEAATLQAQVASTEAELQAAARHTLDGQDKVWAELAHGVEFLDPDARRRARQLVADTFDRIVVWHFGMDGVRTPRTKKKMDLLLVPKGGTAGRMLTVDAVGAWVEGEMVDTSGLPEDQF